MVNPAQEALTADGRAAAGNSLARILRSLQLCLFSKCFGLLYVDIGHRIILGCHVYLVHDFLLSMGLFASMYFL